MVSKYRSLVKKEKSTAVKLKASDYVGLPNNDKNDVETVNETCIYMQCTVLLDFSYCNYKCR